MIRDERLEKMHTFISKNKYTSISDLMDAFCISRATVHRDLKLLDLAPTEFDITRGGVVCLRAHDLAEQAYDEKVRSNAGEKERIAKAACEMIRPNSTIMIDTGTTTIAMVDGLEKVGNLHVVTDDILITTALARIPNITITVLGGNLRSGYFNTCGYYAELLLKQFHFDQAFISIDAVDIASGCTIANSEEVAIKKGILENATQKIMLCDHSKFQARSFAKVCEINEVDVIITGKELNETLYNNIVGAGCDLKLV